MKAAVALVLLVGTARAEPGAHELTVTPGSGTTIGPIRIELSSATLTLPRRRYTRTHAVDPEEAAPRFALRYDAPTAGDHELTIDLRYWQCGKRTCRPLRSVTTVMVHVEAETPPQPSPP